MTFHSKPVGRIVAAGPRYSIIPADAVLDRALSRLALHVLAALGTHADNNGWCIVKQKTLAEKIGSTPNSIANALRELIKHGYVRSRERHGTTGARLANLYQVVMDREPSEALAEDGIADAPPPSIGGGDPHAQMGVPPTPTWGANKNDPLFKRPSSIEETRARAKSDFDLFWDRYPHKIAKASAKRAFEEAVTKVALNELLEAVDRYVSSKPPDRQWCNPTRWLAEERWTDEPATVAPTAKGSARKENLADYLERRFPRQCGRSNASETSEQCGHAGPTIDGEVVQPANERRLGRPTAFQRANKHLYPEIFGDAAGGDEAQP